MHSISHAMPVYWDCRAGLLPPRALTALRDAVWRQHCTHVARATNHRSPITVAYENPVLDRNFPDPGVINFGGVFYAFGTNGGGGNVQAATSPDLVRTKRR